MALNIDVASYGCLAYSLSIHILTKTSSIVIVKFIDHTNLILEKVKMP